MRAFFVSVDSGAYDALLLCIGALFVGYAATEWLVGWWRQR